MAAARSSTRPRLNTVQRGVSHTADVRVGDRRRHDHHGRAADRTEYAGRQCDGHRHQRHGQRYSRLHGCRSRAFQSVSGSPDTRYVVPGQTFDFTVEYNSSNADLAGLGLRIFYNPQVLTFNAFDNVLQTGLFQVQPQPTADTSNLDGYPSTYNYVQIPGPTLQALGRMRACPRAWPCSISRWRPVCRSARPQVSTSPPLPRPRPTRSPALR